MVANICLGTLFEAYHDSLPVCFIHSCNQSGSIYVPGTQGDKDDSMLHETQLSP